MIRRVIPAQRPLEINDGFIRSEVVRAAFTLISGESL
jgi:hypothetical protein